MSVYAPFWIGNRVNYAVASTTSYGGVLFAQQGPAGMTGLISTEANAQCPVGVAGTFTDYYVSVDTNGRTTDTACKFRVNGADSGPSIAVLASTGGVFSDTSHPVTVAVGDLVDQSMATSTGTGTTVFVACGLKFTPSSGNTATGFGAMNFSTTASGTGPLTTYCALGGQSTVNATLGNNQISSPAAGTLSYFSATCTTNGRASSSTTMKLNVNGSVVNQALSWAASTTGRVTDTTHTDTIATGDLICDQIDLGTGTGNFTFTQVSAWLVASTDGQSFAPYGAPGGSALTAGSTLFYPPGRMTTQAAESTAQGKYPAATASKLWAKVSANASTTNSSLVFRKGGATANQVVSITALTTGVFQDTTNSDVYSASDFIALMASGATTGSVTLTAISMLLTVASMSIARSIIINNAVMRAATW